MTLDDHEETNKENSYVASVVSVNSIFIGPVMIVLVVFIRFQVMEIQVEEISSSIGVVETKFSFVRCHEQVVRIFLKRTLHVHEQRCQ